MPLTDEQKAKFKLRLREMSDEELKLGLDIGTINLEWERSLVEMELKRREGEEWADRFNAQESARVKAQQFQAGQMTEQLGIAKGAATAAKWSAVATVALAVLTVFLVTIGAFALLAPESSDAPAASSPPAATKSE